MGRLFDGKRNPRGNDGGGNMSEQEDIDSDFLPDSEHGTMISEHDVGEDMYYSSHSGRNGSPLVKGNNGEDSDVDSDPGSVSDTDSEEYYGNKRINNINRDKARNEKDVDTDCSPTSVSEMVGDGSGKEDPKKGKKVTSIVTRKVTRKGSFLNRIFGGKNRKNKINTPSDSDIEYSESNSEAESSKLLNPAHMLDVGAESPMQANSVLDGTSQSQLLKSLEKDKSRAPSANEAHASSSANSAKNQKRSKKLAQQERRKKYESAMHRVTEEDEADDIERSFQRDEVTTKELKAGERTPPGQVKKRVQNIHNMMQENVRRNSLSSGSSKKKKKNSVHSRSSRKKTRSAHKRNDAGLNRVSPDPSVHTEEKTKKMKPKTKPKSSKNLNSHPAASSARNHGNAVISRIDYTGQILPSSFNGISSSSSLNYLPNQSSSDMTPKFNNGNTDKLINEVHRLNKLVELMMTRMELYEKQSECLVETSLEHNRQWKMATIEIHDLKKREHQNPTDEKLADIKNLLIERSVQEKWIRQMEEIQRGYQDRLTATNKQLKVLRYAHVKTSKQIFSMRKNNSGSIGSTPETSVSTRNKNINEMNIMTPVARNIPLARWTDEANDTSGTTAALPVLPVGPKDAVDGAQNNKNASNVDSKGDRNGKKLSQTLLAEMIVSWHTTTSDMSPLSDKGKSRDNSKKRKDKKKKKKRKEEIGAIL